MNNLVQVIPGLTTEADDVSQETQKALFRIHRPNIVLILYLGLQKHTALYRFVCN